MCGGDRERLIRGEEGEEEERIEAKSRGDKKMKRR